MYDCFVTVKLICKMNTDEDFQASFFTGRLMFLMLGDLRPDVTCKPSILCKMEKKDDQKAQPSLFNSDYLYK